jgi:hypothetical protein
MPTTGIETGDAFMTAELDLGVRLQNSRDQIALEGYIEFFTHRSSPLQI